VRVGLAVRESIGGTQRGRDGPGGGVSLGTFVCPRTIGCLPVKFFFSAVFRSMAAEFLAIELWERSVVRAAVAYGPVILGRECKAGAQILQEMA